MRIGLMGGTFDPIHLGHLALAEEVVEACRLDSVILVPARVPPHKSRPRMASPWDRLVMAELAVLHDDSLFVSRAELLRTGPSYTIDTVAWFSERLTDSSIFFIMGIDAFQEFHTWHRYEDLSEQIHIIVTTRPGSVELADGECPRPLVDLLGGAPPRFHSADQIEVPSSSPGFTFLRIDGVEVSSTQIRRELQDRGTLRYGVPEDVMKFINKHGLYGASRRPGAGDELPADLRG